MQFFTQSRRGRITFGAGLLAAVSALLSFFGLWALAFVGITAGLVVINMLVAENVYKSRQSAATSGAGDRHSLKGLNLSVARIEASLSEMSASAADKTLGETNSGGSSEATNSEISSLAAAVDSMARKQDFQQWWSLHTLLLKVSPQAATALALPPVLSRLHDGQTILMLGTAATASWAYETLIKRHITVGRAYLGFHSSAEREDFEAFVARKAHRLDHVSFVVDAEPRPAASIGGLPATAVDMMLIDFGASESHEDVLAAVPQHYWRWLREEAELVVIDSRQGLAARATSSVLSHREDFVVAMDSDDPYTRNLKRAAL